MTAAIHGVLLSASPDRVELRIDSPADYADAQQCWAVGGRCRALTSNDNAYIGIIDDIVELDDGNSGFLYLRDAQLLGGQQRFVDTPDGVRFACEVVSWTNHDSDAGVDRRADLGGLRCWIYSFEHRNQRGYRAAITPSGGGRVIAVTTSWLSLTEAIAAGESTLRCCVQFIGESAEADQRRRIKPAAEEAF